MPVHQVAVSVAEPDRVALVVDPFHLALVSLFYPERLVPAVEDHRVTRRVVRGPGHLGACQAPRHQLLALPRRTGDRALCHELRPDRLVYLVPQRPCRRYHPGCGTLFGREREPPLRRFLADILPLDLRDPVPELPERGPDLPSQARTDRLLEIHVAPAEDLVHHRGLHPGPPELLKRLPCLHRPELLLVPDQHYACNPERGHRPQQSPHLLAGCERGLVHHQHRL